MVDIFICFRRMTLFIFLESPEMPTPVNSMRNRRRSYGNLRRNIRQLFQLYPRLAKTMKRYSSKFLKSKIFFLFFSGLYLVSVMLNGERILVTNEDVLPMVEVDENYGHNLLGDFQWFMKLTFVWDDLKTLRPDLERCSSATTFYLRMKLVQAAIELQVQTIKKQFYSNNNNKIFSCFFF